MLRSYADIPDDLVARASASARARARAAPPADRRTGLHALKLAQARQKLREGRPEAVEAALVSAGLLADEAKSPLAGSAEPGMPIVRWFVVQTKPGAENTAIKALVDAGYRVCAPTIGQWVKLHRRDAVRVRHAFPRYLFVGLVPDARGDLDFRSPRLCDGVAAFVEGAGGRVEIRDTAIGDLMAATERGWLDLIWAKAAAHGQTPKKLRTPGFWEDMTQILSADPMNRMRLFLAKYGTRSALSGSVVCGISEA